MPKYPQLWGYTNIIANAKNQDDAVVLSYENRLYFVN